MIHFQILHMFTPETATSTHYFWASARRGDRRCGVSEASRTRAVNTFLEDVDALERIEAIRTGEAEDSRKSASPAIARAC